MKTFLKKHWGKLTSAVVIAATAAYPFIPGEYKIPVDAAIEIIKPLILEHTNVQTTN